MSTYVRLLGTPALKFDGEWIVPPTTKLSALLYYFIHKEHWVDRSVLTYLSSYAKEIVNSEPTLGGLITTAIKNSLAGKCKEWKVPNYV